MTPAPSRPPTRRLASRLILRRSAWFGFFLHAGAVLWIWIVWQSALRETVLVWIDLPVSVLWMGSSGRWLLAWSLIVGGVYWALLAALLSALAGRLSARRRNDDPLP